jgi:hypothetical protein
MATEVRPARSAPTGKYDAFIQAQLDRAEKRIRLLDLTAALLGLLAGTLGFAVLMVLLDRQFVLSAGTRQFALAAYALAAAVYLAVAVVRPLRWRVNPYYAARQLEQLLPNAKNSVVNWVDLHEQKLPSVLRGAVGQRAAKDLARADVERAISGRRTTSAGVGAAAFGVLLAALFFVLGPRPFVSLLGRAFVPLSGAPAPATSTWVEVLRPQGGHATIPVGSPCTVVAEVGGKVPEANDPRAPRLLYRQEPDEPWRERFLQRDDSRREWSVTLSPVEVGNGFWYKVAAGDAESPEYRVAVRAAPLITAFLVTYNYRAYTARAPRVSADRNLSALRGTEADVLLSSNRPVREGKLEIEVTDGTNLTVRSDPVPGDPHALRFRFPLDQTGKYRARFTSAEGETYVDPLRYDLIARPDGKPYVKLTEPGKNVELPANGLLQLKGEAHDDVGVAALTLRLQVVGGARLRPQPYRSPARLRLAGGGHPTRVEYQDFVDLAQVKDESARPAPLKVGSEVEYWLEASDACDYPRPNVAESSPRYRVKILPPSKDKKQGEKERRQAEQKKKDHQRKQDERLDQEDQERRDQRQQQEERNQEERRKAEQQRQKGGKDGKEDGQKDKAEGGQGGQDKKDKNGEGGAGEKAGQPDKGGTSQGQQKKDRDTQKKADDLRKAVEERERRKQEEAERNQGEGKGAGKAQEEKSPGKGKGAGDGESKPGGKPGEARASAPSADRKGAAESKPDGPGNEDGRAEAAQGREGGADTKPGQGRTQGTTKEGPPPRAEAEGAGIDKAGNPPPGTAKGKTAGPKDERRAQQGKTRPAPRQPDAREAEPRAQARDDKPSTGEPRPEEAKPSDVEKLARKLESPDRARREEAAKQLERIKDKASDPEAREEARAALENAPSEPSRARGREGAPPGKKGRSLGEAKQGAKKGQQGTGDAKQTGPGKLQKDEAKGGESEQQGSQDARQKELLKKAQDLARRLGSKDEGERKKAEKDLDELKKRVGDEGWGELEKRLRDRPSAARARPRPQAPRPHRAGVMQLEDLRKGVDKDLLKDLNMSEEEFRKFLKDYEDLLKRPRPRPGADEKLPPSQRGGALPSMGGRRIQPSGTGRPEDLRYDGRAKPPPGYQDAYNELLRRQSAGEK